jgi:hypothetical protein
MAQGMSEISSPHDQSLVTTHAPWRYWSVHLLYYALSLHAIVDNGGVLLIQGWFVMLSGVLIPEFAVPCSSTTLCWSAHIGQQPPPYSAALCADARTWGIRTRVHTPARCCCIGCMPVRHSLVPFPAAPWSRRSHRIACVDRCS